MPWADILQSGEKLAIGILCVAAFAAVSALSVSVIARISGARIPFSSLHLGAMFLFGFLAFVIGLVMAASRVGAVADVVPGALTLIGGVALFLFNREAGDRLLVASAVFGFSAMLLFGTILGSYERERALRQAEWMAIDPQRLHALAEIEFFVNAFRKSRGLDPLPPLAGGAASGEK